MQNCIFCQISRGEIPAEIVYEDDHVLVFKDIHPVAPVHLVLIPRKHIPSLMDIKGEEDAASIGRLHLAAVRAAEKMGLEERGFRLVSNYGKDAEQLVWHVHYHLIGGRHLQWPPG